MSQPSFISLVTLEEYNCRLDSYIYTKLNQTISREKIKQAILEGGCFINDKPCYVPSKRLKVGVKVSMFSRKRDACLLDKYPCSPLEVLYQDEFFIVVNKPAGLMVHPALNCSEVTLVHCLLKQFPQLAKQDGDRPGIVHRLDKDTSGLICIALTEEARLALIQLFAARRINKTYLALVHGVPDVLGKIQTMIGRHPRVKTKMAVTLKGKLAYTTWEVLYSGYKKKYGLLAINIHTGRTHQIRVHMEYLGYPILGDQVYFIEEQRRKVHDIVSRQMLHAWKLDFKHPFTNQELHFFCPPPADFFCTALALEKSPIRAVLTGVAGSGKSLTLNFLKEYGVATWSADQVVKRLYSPGGEVWKIFWERYGNIFILDKGSPIDHEKLLLALSGEFEIPINQHELARIVHPFVFQDLIIFWELVLKKGLSYAVAEVPLWFESSFIVEEIKKTKPWIVPDIVVGVFCPDDIRCQRLKENRCWSPEKQMQMDCWQFDQEKKLSFCSYLINNTEGVEVLEVESKKFLHKLESLAEDKVRLFSSRWEKIVCGSSK